MSLSNPSVKNPAVKFIEFKGESGIFQYFDKEIGKNIPLSFPIFFIVLDELHTVRGFNQRLKAGVFSNEIRSIKNDIMNVRVFKSDIKLVGVWDSIKDEVNRIQGHYSKSVYAALIKSRTDVELVNFQMHGASRSPWFEFKGDKQKFGISIYETIDDNSGTVSFKRPVFKSIKISEDVMKKAIELDKQLQLYLKQYFIQKIDETSETIIEVQPPAQQEVEQKVVIYADDTNFDDMISNKIDELPF